MADDKNTFLEVLDRLSEIQQSITDVELSFNFVPRSIEPHECPAMYNVPGPAQRDIQAGEDQWKEERIYRMQLFVGEFTKGTEGEVERRAYGIMMSIYDEFNKRPRLEFNDEGVCDRAIIIGDSGIMATEYPAESGMLFIYIEFRLAVTMSNTFSRIFDLEEVIYGS